MATSEYDILRLSDRQVIERFTDVWEAVGSPDSTRFAVTPISGAQQLGWTAGEPVPEALADLFGEDVASVASVYLQFPSNGMHVAVNRNPGRDRLVWGIHDNLPPTAVLPFVAAVAAGFRDVNQIGRFDALSPDLNEFYNRREQALLRLEDTHQQVIESAAAYRRELEEETARTREVERARTEALHRELQEDAERRKAALDEREAQLNDLRRSLDDRSATHARRETRKEIKKILAEREQGFRLSAETVAKRRPTEWAFRILIAVGVVSFGVALWHARAETLPALGRLLVTSLTSLGQSRFISVGRTNGRKSMPRRSSTFGGSNST